MGIPPCKSHFGGCRKPRDTRFHTDARPKSRARCLPGSPPCWPPPAQLFPPPALPQASCEPSPAPSGRSRRCRSGAGRSGAAPGRSGGTGAAPSAPCRGLPAHPAAGKCRERWERDLPSRPGIAPDTVRGNRAGWDPKGSEHTG